MARKAPSVTCSAHSSSVRKAAKPGQSMTWKERPPSSKLSGWSDSVKLRFFSSGSASSREVEPSGLARLASATRRSASTSAVFPAPSAPSMEKVRITREFAMASSLPLPARLRGAIGCVLGTGRARLVCNGCPRKRHGFFSPSARRRRPAGGADDEGGQGPGRRARREGSGRVRAVARYRRPSTPWAASPRPSSMNWMATATSSRPAARSRMARPFRPSTRSVRAAPARMR